METGLLSFSEQGRRKTANLLGTNNKLHWRLLMITLKMLDSHNHGIKFFEKSIKKLYDGRTELIILEAGCGREWPLDLADIRYKIVGVDLDEEALKSRVNDKKDLDEAIVADLQDFDIGNRKVDVIYCSFVLEHVENAELMIENFNNMLKPGGLLILILPDRNTVFGFITRITPFWCHVIYKKYIRGFKNAGRPGFAPYPTYYNKIVSRDGIHSFCKSHDFVINEEYGYCGYLRKKNIKTKLVRIFAILMNIISIGKLPWHYNNIIYILKKTEAPNE